MGRQVLPRSEEHTSELQSRRDLVCRLLLEKKKKINVPVFIKKTYNLSKVYLRQKKQQRRRYLQQVETAQNLEEVFYSCCVFFFFNDTATTEIYTLSLHDALPISLPVILLVVFGEVFHGTIGTTGVAFRQYFTAGIIASGIMSATFVNVGAS